MKNIAIIGTGNVAWHLAKALHTNGVNIIQVFGKNQTYTTRLATSVSAQPINKLVHLKTNYLDAIIIAVKDDAICEVSAQIPQSKTIVTHTSGTVSMDVLKQHKNHGVFYPLQTFSKTKKMDLSRVPFCIEGSVPEAENQLLQLAEKISQNVQLVNSDTRKSIHIAAVFACNFSNHMLSIADYLLHKSGQDFHILKPLLQETLDKAFEQSPTKAQTGPAIRNDIRVMENHLRILDKEPLLKDIYKYVSQSIQSFKYE